MQVHIARIGEVLFQGAAKRVTLPSSTGELTILAHHEPLIATLTRGVLCVEDTNGKEHSVSVSGGVVEVSGNSTTVLLS